MGIFTKHWWMFTNTLWLWFHSELFSIYELHCYLLASVFISHLIAQVCNNKCPVHASCIGQNKNYSFIWKTTSDRWKDCFSWGKKRVDSSCCSLIKKSSRYGYVRDRMIHLIRCISDQNLISLWFYLTFSQNVGNLTSLLRWPTAPTGYTKYAAIFISMLSFKRHLINVYPNIHMYLLALQDGNACCGSS